MLEQKTLKLEDALNKLAMVADSLRYIAAKEERSEMEAVLTLLRYALNECLLALDPPSYQ